MNGSAGRKLTALISSSIRAVVSAAFFARATLGFHAWTLMTKAFSVAPAPSGYLCRSHSTNETTRLTRKEELSIT